jgi:hypothetical protein
VGIAESAIERTEAMGADGSESRVTLALALCQADRADGALAALDQVVIPSPYFHSVRALARALTADAAGAIADACVVGADGGATYLDRLVADVAAATGHLQLGDHDGAVADLRRARATAGEAGDVVAREMVTAAHEALLGEPHRGETDHLGPGWRGVVEALHASVPDVAGEPVT